MLLSGPLPSEQRIKAQEQGALLRGLISRGQLVWNGIPKSCDSYGYQWVFGFSLLITREIAYGNHKPDQNVLRCFSRLENCFLMYSLEGLWLPLQGLACLGNEGNIWSITADYFPARRQDWSNSFIDRYLVYLTMSQKTRVLEKYSLYGANEGHFDVRFWKRAVSHSYSG